MYLEFYGLKEQPFNITPDPRFLFYSPRHRESFEHLIYGVEQRKGFIELVGEVGCGKTTLCRAVLENLAHKNNMRTALVLNPAVNETQLLRAILTDFGLEPREGRDRLTYIHDLNEFLLQQMEEGNNVALFIDEAQDLQPHVLEQIRLLNNLETDQYKLLQIVLSGQPELKQRLQRSDLRQLRQRIMVRCELHALSEMETGMYIAHRLHVAGATGGVAFESDAVRLIYKKSRGIPRVINTISDNTMLAGYVAGARKITRAEVKRALRHIGSVH